MHYLIDRLKERSTWRGIIFVLSALGVGIKPELQESIVVAGLALAGMVEALMPETRKQVVSAAPADKKPEAPPLSPFGH